MHTVCLIDTPLAWLVANFLTYSESDKPALQIWTNFYLVKLYIFSASLANLILYVFNWLNT